MNRTAAWIFVCAIAGVSLLEAALAAFNFLHHDRWLFVVGPLVLALGMSLQALGAILRRDGKPAAPRIEAAPSRRLAGPGGHFRKL
jgi:hypothetical protein